MARRMRSGMKKCIIAQLQRMRFKTALQARRAFSKAKKACTRLAIRKVGRR